MTAEQIAEYNPQRFEFWQLDALLKIDKEEKLIVGARRVKDDEFWVRGHLPDRPLFPGAMMIETMAQMASLQCHLQFDYPDGIFLGFGGVDECRFRDSVEPPCDLWVAGRIISGTATRPVIKWGGQILRENGKIVCEAIIFGVRV